MHCKFDHNGRWVPAQPVPFFAWLEDLCARRLTVGWSLVALLGLWAAIGWMACSIVHRIVG